MAVLKGDTLITGASGIAVLELAGGWQVILEPGTDLTIENPSLFVRLGRVIIKTLRDVREALTVKTDIAAAAVEGTEFLIEVNQRQEMAVTVLEGQVRVTPRDSTAWREVVYAAGERGVVTERRWTRMAPLTPTDARALRQRITTIDRVARPVVPNLEGLTATQAQTELERLGLRASVVRVAADSGEGGKVVRTEAAGATRRVGDVVRIQVSDAAMARAAPVSGVTVPKVAGQSVAAAMRQITAAGLRVGDTASVATAEAEDGTVMATKPAAGTVVQRGTAVSFTIARKPVLRVSPEILRAVRPATCTVPSLLRLTEEAAKKVLADGGWRVGQVQRLGQGRTVTAQKPEARATASCGSPIDFTIGTIRE
jgi:beta-lactam-binding protein with PASTA domain